MELQVECALCVCVTCVSSAALDVVCLLGTAKELVVVDYGQRMKEALDHTHTVIQHSSQALLLGSGIVADSLHFSLVRRYLYHTPLL